ncbi:MAG: MBOAT family O-acyltransferase [Clostridia bacterium]
MRAKNIVLLLFSLLFYGWGEPVWIICMLFVTAVNYFGTIAFASEERNGFKKFILVLTVGLSLATLVWFKYASFLANAILGLFGKTILLPGIALPIGISFYTFQAITYSVDVYRGVAAPQRNPLQLLLYVSCFPQLIAGPIVQYADVEIQLAHRTVSMDDFSSGMRRFAVGLGKKVLLANLLGHALKGLPMASGGAPQSTIGAWYGILLFALQIYFDFSAYSDMAIGLGRVIGFSYRENFNFPYIARSITDFWRRWHISIGTFFREYVYIPLGGSRRSFGRTAINLMIVWGLTGLWHGASWNFLLWGLYYGILMIFERRLFGKQTDKLPRAIGIVLTSLLVLFGWVLFYYTDLSAAWHHLLAMFGRNAQGSTLPWIDPATVHVIRQYTVLPLIGCILCLPLSQWLERAFIGHSRHRQTAVLASTILLTAVVLLSVLFLVSESYNPFIYFRF